MKKNKLFVSVAALMLTGSAVSFASMMGLNAFSLASPDVSEVEAVAEANEVAQVNVSDEPQLKDFFVENPDFTGGTQYLLYNVEAQGYLLGTNNWGTRASYTTSVNSAYKITVSSGNADGLYSLNNYCLAKGGGLYAMDCQGTNNIWTDGTGRAGSGMWQFTAQSDGSFLISNTNVTDGGNPLYLSVVPGSSEDKEVIAGTSLYMSNDADAQKKWKFVSVNYLTALEEWEKSNYNVGDDVTSLAPGTWTVEQGNGPNAYSTGIETFGNPSFSAGKVIYQKIEGLKNGNYEVTFYAAANLAAWNGQTGSGAGIAQVYANTTTYGIDVIDQKACTLSDYEYTLTATVTDGTLEYGLQNIATGGCWYVCQLIKITFVSEGVDLTVYANQLKEAVEKAETVSGKMNQDVQDALDKAISDNKNATYTSADDYNTAIAAVNAAAEAAKTSIANYEEAKSYIDKSSTLDAAGKAVYASDQTVAAVTSAYQSGSLVALSDNQKTAMNAAIIAAAKVQTTAGADMTLAIANPTIINYAGSNTAFPNGGWDAENSTHTGWSWTKATGDTYFENWNASAADAAFDFNQTITGLPNGTYTVSADLFNTQGTGPNGTCGVYAKAANEVFAGVTQDHGDKFQTYTTEYVYVVDGTLKLGVKTTGTPTAGWFAADNFKLTYVATTYPKEYDIVAPTAIAVNVTASMYVGGTATASATFTPDNATATGTWSTSNASVATVDAQGNVTAVGVGEATITFTSDIDQNVSGSAKVSVDYRSSLANGSFDEGTLATANVAGGSAGLAADIPGWTHSAAQAWLTASAIAYGDGAQINGCALPAADNTHNGGALGLSAGWGSGATYSQTIKLAAGTYKLSFDIYNTKPGTSSNSTLTVGFNGNDITGTTYGDEWKTYTTTFTLTEATVGDAYIKIAGANAGSGNQGKLVIDNVTLAPLSAEELAAIEAHILADAKTAKIAEIDKLSPVGDGLFQYSSAVINRVKATVNTATTVDAVNAVELPLVTAPAADKAFMLTSPQGNYLVVNNGVKLASEQKAIYFIQNNDGTFAISDGEVRVANGSNAWSLAANADGSAYTVAAVDGGITIKSDQGFFGMDNDADGATVFRNKAATTFAIADYVAPVNEIALNDDADYDPTVSSNGKTVTYTRNFTNTKWQALFLPFAFDVTKQDGLSFATLSDINAYDEDEDGAIDKTHLEYLVKKTGTIDANTPVLVKADKTGEYTITADGELSAETNTYIVCASTERDFYVYGSTYAVAANKLNGSYAMANGSLYRADGNDGLKPYRWFVDIQSKELFDDAMFESMKNKAAKSDENKVFADHTEYTSIEPTVYNSLTYTRNFSNTYWQTMFVPFSISAEDAAKAGLKLGRVSDVNLYDNDEDGELDEMELEVITLGAGQKTIPGVPYFVKAAKAGQKSINVSDATIYDFESSLQCYPFDGYEYSICGATSRVNMYAFGYLTVNGGQLCRFGEGATLSSQRWYIDYSARNDVRQANMRVNIIGDEDIDVTAIESLDLDDATDKDAIFTADGRLVSNDGKTAGLRPGLYIKGGKKFVVK